MSLEWKVSLIVTRQHADQLKQGIASLLRLGFTQQHIFCQDGVKVPSSENVIRHRVESNTELGTWQEAIDSMSRFAHCSDLFLLTTPNLEFWPHLKVFVEATNEPDFVGVYLPYTPDQLWVDDESRTLPCSGSFGWCEQAVTAMTEADRCLIANNRTLPLLAYHLQSRDWLYDEWSPVFAECLGRSHKIPTFFAKMSLARPAKTSDNPELQSVQFNPENADEVNYYLPRS